MMRIDELNGKIERGEIEEFIRVEEARQVKVLSRIADDVCARAGVRLVLMAGASSAGKTTTATRLCTQLRVNGRTTMHMSTDDYFVGDARNPRAPDGSLDYEHFACVDAERLAADVAALLSGEVIRRRCFDFLKHEGYDSADLLGLPSDGVIVIEGLHALNPKLLGAVPGIAAYRVFIEPKPNIEVFPGHVQTSEQARFLRRLVRDNQFRRLNPVETLKMWPKVLAGEQIWIEPFRSLADVTFNSYLPYELAVLRPYVEGLLVRAMQEVGKVPQIMTTLAELDVVSGIGATVVPGDSILREAIGGSQLEY